MIRLDASRLAATFQPWSQARLAEVLVISPADLLGVETMAGRKRSKLGLKPQLQLRFERIQRVPGKNQETVMWFLDTVLENLKG